jgi:hypothetical protein
MSNELLVKRVLTENYRAPQVNVKILKRYRKQVLLVKPTQTVRARWSLPTISNSV